MNDIVYPATSITPISREKQISNLLSFWDTPNTPSCSHSYRSSSKMTVPMQPMRRDHWTNSNFSLTIWAPHRGPHLAGLQQTSVAWPAREWHATNFTQSTSERNSPQTEIHPITHQNIVTATAIASPQSSTCQTRNRFRGRTAGKSWRALTSARANVKNRSTKRLHEVLSLMLTIQSQAIFLPGNRQGTSSLTSSV